MATVSALSDRGLAHVRKTTNPRLIQNANQPWLPAGADEKILLPDERRSREALRFGMYLYSTGAGVRGAQEREGYAQASWREAGNPGQLPGPWPCYL